MMLTEFIERLQVIESLHGDVPIIDESNREPYMPEFNDDEYPAVIISFE